MCVAIKIYQSEINALENWQNNIKIEMANYLHERVYRHKYGGRKN